MGAASLKGKEVAEMLNERNFPAADIRLLDDDESMGQLEAMGDEISFIQRVRAEQFENVDFTFFASDEESTRKNWKDARDAGSAIIDLSAALENEPGASVRSLWVERERGQIPAPELQPGPCVAAHPVAVTLALLLLRARKAGAIRRVSRHDFRTSFRARPARHGRVAPADGEPALLPASAERRLRRAGGLQHGGALRPEVAARARFRARLAFSATIRRLPETALRSLRSCCCRLPIFHGHAMAVFLEMDSPVDVQTLSQALAGDHVAIPGAEEDSPSNVSAAGQADIQLSLKIDPAQPNGVWLWAAADNLRISALTAVECAESMTATRPTGKIQ